MNSEQIAGVTGLSVDLVLQLVGELALRNSVGLAIANFTKQYGEFRQNYWGQLARLDLCLGISGIPGIRDRDGAAAKSS
jgi:hypothetical protein